MILRRIGILGGMGPEATVLLMQRIIAATPAADDADHIPLLVDQNPQVPSRIRRLIEGIGEDPGPVLAAMARRLEAAGAEALAMPCNTAHHYAATIRAATVLPFIDMVALSADHALRLAGKGGRIGVLASPAVRSVGLFDAVLAERDLAAIYPADEDALLSIIRRIKAEGVGPEVREALAAAARDLAARGGGTQMIACTEFSLIASAAAQEASVFDTLDVLVNAIVDFAAGRSGQALAGQAAERL